MNPLKRVRKACEAVLVRLGLILIPCLPRRAVLGFARALGSAAFLLPLSLKRIGRANLDIAFGDTRSADEKKRILRQSYQTFAQVMLDICWFARNASERIPRHVHFDPELEKRLFQKKAHICVTAHMGNWEFLGHAVSLRGYPLNSVAAPLVNPAVDVLFNRIRQVSGQRIIPRQGALRSMIRILREEGKVGLLLDQNTRLSEGGIYIDFFGLPALMTDAAAALAIRTHTDILFGFCIPQPDGTYVVRTAPGITPPAPDAHHPKGQARRLTEEIAAVTERQIRENPGAWLWMYKRWKYIPTDREPSEYPFYARRPMTDTRLATPDTL